MEKITNPHAAAAALIVGGALDEFVGKVYGVATALDDGTLVWNPDQGTDGRWNGGKVLFDKIMAESLKVPSSYQSQISKIATGIRELGASCIVSDHDKRMAAVRQFCEQYESLNNLSSILYPNEEKVKPGRTMPAAIAALLAEAVKYEWDMQETTAEFLSQMTALVEGK